jgi:hypothetical protein
VLVWYVAPLEMNEGTHWGQGYNKPPTGCSAEERPNKRPLTLTLTVCKIVHTCFAAATEFSCVFRMADTSSYSIEERLMASVCARERQHTGQTMS